MLNICDNGKCTGCGLCSNVCSKHAIEMKPQGERGHFVPDINQNLCVDCGLCKRLCPVNHDLQYRQNLKTYAAWQTNEKKRAGSSSGGLAAAFYEQALKDGYVIAGVQMTPESGAVFNLSESSDDILRFKGSKYIQAETRTIYNEVSEHLRKGRKALFIGTPCQCEAIRSFVTDKHSTQLITVEIICHGVPSQKVFSEYLKIIEKKKRKLVDKVSFRSERGVDLILESGNSVVWKHKLSEDEYLNAFNYGLLFNDACYSCRYACPERCSDLMIGDFWNIGKDIPFSRPDCHVSVVGVFTEKGETFLSRCSELHLEERPYEEAVTGNINLRRPSNMHKDFNQFWKVYNKEGLTGAIKSVYGSSLIKTRIRNYCVGNAKKLVKKILRIK